MKTYHSNPHHKDPSAFSLAQSARHTLTTLETRFWRESHARWPKVRWRRYSPVTIKAFSDTGPSTWYAPFLCVEKKLIVVFDDRPDFPYRIYGQNRTLYERHGYTVLDFSEDFSAPWDESVWHDAMAMIDQALCRQQAA